MDAIDLRVTNRIPNPILLPVPVRPTIVTPVPVRRRYSIQSLIASSSIVPEPLPMYTQQPSSPFYSPSTSNSGAPPQVLQTVTSSQPVNNFEPSTTVTRSFPVFPINKGLLGMNSNAIFLTTEYEEFRNKILAQYGGRDRPYNRNMRRTVASNPERIQDPEYLEKRKKNNIAAKRSRETRRAREDEQVIRLLFLERENFKLKSRLVNIEKERKKLEEKTRIRVT